MTSSPGPTQQPQWQPPTAEQRRNAALAMRAGAKDALVATIARLRIFAIVIAVIGAVICVVGAPALLFAMPVGHKTAAFAPAAAGLGMVALGIHQWTVFRPLPKHLLTTGIATPAVVLDAGMVGPTIQTRGFGVEGQLMRRRYRLELRPRNAAPYQVEVRTFDGPSMLAVNRPPLTVYVHPRDRMTVCPDWSTVPNGA